MTKNLIPQPVPNEPALYDPNQKLLFIVDLHIGIENELQQNGLHIPSQTSMMSTRLQHLIETYNPKGLVLLGDVKHTVPTMSTKERSDVKRFLKQFADQLPLHIIPGNHDGNLSWLIPNKTTIYPITGANFDTIGCLHGHSWPREHLLLCQYLTMGHTHPMVRLTDRLGFNSYEPVWVKGKLKLPAVSDRHTIQTSPEVIILPAFNPLCGGVAVNHEHPLGSIAKHLDETQTHLFLLDGTDLGTIQKLSEQGNKD
ncbi:MAG: metallophosphoesterase [Candidatus Thermoplasmatota archaeon]|nr:metallophosphoesterase [Candidatus Thermoplasmatota archaeon]MBU1941333.1 metallophosphoesterase [Candidatus Thermoplasmatota archaeon]